MAHMTQADWDRHIETINEYHEDAFQQEITWRKNITNLNRYGEDSNVRYKDITIKCLIDYNSFRTWPINLSSDTGILDKQSLVAYFNIKYLRDLGYLDSNDIFNFNPGLDKFIVNGILYRTEGESQVSQAHNMPLMIFLILQREETSTGDTYNGFGGN